MADIPRRKPMPPAYQPPQDTAYGHSRSRTTSSGTFPAVLYPPQTRLQQYPSNMQVHAYTSRRPISQATTSTTNSQDLGRSASSRSAGLSQPTSYVALMRKQKATVWCDRSQQEDPRLLAAQRAAKLRATMEVIGGPGPGRTSTSGSGSNRVAAKIRHHGKASLMGYSPGDLVGGVGGVPMRLSASEVDVDNSDDDDAGSGNMQYNGSYHQRTASGRSSLGSARKGRANSRHSGASSTAGRRSSVNTPPGHRLESMEDLAEAGETPVPATHKAEDYFTADGNGDGTRSVGSGSSGERADHVGELGSGDAARLASNSLIQSTVTREKSLRNPEDLRRRGSVDERTMTMSAGRLYIANPDTDSD